MTTFTQFCDNCKMRHDFDDQIQVRYRHTNGEDYDTWISGEDSNSAQKVHWVTMLHDRGFRVGVLELAWIQLEGSFPESDLPKEQNDWL